MIKTILWDVDRTLLDFDAAERAAIQSLFVEFGLGECSEEQVARYSVLNMKYWEKLERGEITKPQVLVGRFEEFFAEEGIDVSLAPQFNDAYQLRLGDTIVYRDDSYEIVKSLRGKVRQCVVSNGTVVAPDEEADALRPRRADGRRVPLRAAWRGEAEKGVFRPGLRRHRTGREGRDDDRRRFAHERYPRRRQRGHRDPAGTIPRESKRRRVTASTTRSGICTRSTACCDKKREEDIPKRIGMSSFLRLLLVLQPPQADAERLDVEGLGDVRIHTGLAAVLHIYNAVH